MFGYFQRGVHRAGAYGRFSWFSSPFRAPNPTHSEVSRRRSRCGGFWKVMTSVPRLHSETLASSLPSAGLQDGYGRDEKRQLVLEPLCAAPLSSPLSTTHKCVQRYSIFNPLCCLFSPLSRDSLPETVMLPSVRFKRNLCKDLSGKKKQKGKHRTEFNVIQKWLFLNDLLTFLTNRKKLILTNKRRTICCMWNKHRMTDSL